MSRRGAVIHSDEVFDRYAMSKNLRKFVEKTPDDKVIDIGSDVFYLASKLSCAAAWMDEKNPNYKQIIKYAYSKTKTKKPMGELRAMLLAAADALERPLGDV